MLYFTLRYLYFFFLFFLFFLLSFQWQIIWEVKNYIFISYILAWIPIYDFLIDFFKKELISEHQKNLLQKIKEITKNTLKKIFSFLLSYKKLISFLLIWGIIYFFFKESVGTFFWVLFIFLNVYFRLDARISFFWALLLLLMVPLFLILGDQTKAETLSIYVYYFLVLWVFFSIIESYYTNIYDAILWLITKGKKLLQENFSWLFSSYEDIVYDSFFVFFLFFLFSLYYQSIYQLLPGFFLFIFMIYLLWKIVWFSFQKDSEKISFFNTQYFHHYALFLSINIIVYSQILSHTQWGDNIYYLLWISFWIFFVFMTIFSDIWEIIKKSILRNAYISLVIFFILWMSGAYLLKPYFIPQISPQEIILPQENWWQEPVVEPIEIEALPQEKQFDISMFGENLKLGSQWEGVKILQSFLNEAGYYNFSFHGNYDDKTQIAMKRFLSSECDWPETNQWILWPQARDCIEEFLEKK